MAYLFVMVIYSINFTKMSLPFFCGYYTVLFYLKNLHVVPSRRCMDFTSGVNVQGMFGTGRQEISLPVLRHNHRID